MIIKEVRQKANRAWNNLNYALAIIDGGGPRAQLIELLEQAQEVCDQIVKGEIEDESQVALCEINTLKKALCRAREGLGHHTNIGCTEEHCTKCMHWTGIDQDLREETNVQKNP